MLPKAWTCTIACFADDDFMIFGSGAAQEMLCRTFTGTVPAVRHSGHSGTDHFFAITSWLAFRQVFRRVVEGLRHDLCGTAARRHINLDVGIEGAVLDADHGQRDVGFEAR